MTQPEPDPGRQREARKYGKLSRQLFILELLIGAILLLALPATGLSGSIRDLLDIPEPARAPAYFVFLMLSCILLVSPINFYRNFAMPRRYRLSNQTFTAWAMDELKEGLIGLVLGCALVTIVYFFLRSYPDAWWLLAAGALTILIIIMTRLGPVLVVPLFFKVEPLKNPALRQKLLDLARRAGTRVADVFEINFSSKTSTANAMVMGWGNTRRIALSDTLLDRYTPEEIEVIMAHELAHQKHGDVLKLISIQAASMLLGLYVVNLLLHRAVLYFGFTGISDIAALPILILALPAVTLVLAPLVNHFSCRIEEAADFFALTVTGNPEAFTSMLTKLTDQNLSESRPNRLVELLFYDHPPYYKRVLLAHAYSDKEKYEAYPGQAR